MQFKSEVVSKQQIKQLANSDCLLIPVFNPTKLGELTKSLADSDVKFLQKMMKREHFTGDLKQSLLLANLPSNDNTRVLLFGLGNKKKLQQAQFIKAINTALGQLLSTSSKNATLLVGDINADQLDAASACYHTIINLQQKLYQTPHQKKASLASQSLTKLSFLTQDKSTQKHCQANITSAKATALGMRYCRELGDLEPNVCTPTYLAKQAQSLARQYGSKFKTTILNEKDLQRLKMGALLAVAKGSRQTPKLISMEYKGGKAKQAPIVLVGKGVTFDTGGISLKPPANMGAMKYDMCGAASVFGTMKAIAELQLPINVVGLVPSAENMPDGQAYRPGDIIKSMSGLTIEITNTDAEGRLLLCDALTYAKKFKPKFVIDIATLTGACLVALGTSIAALMSNDEKLSDNIKMAGEAVYDRVWPMPLDDTYHELLSSPFADMINAAERYAGTITAGCFLSRFSEDYRWAHLDVAGTAMPTMEGRARASGRPVPLLVKLLESEVHG